MRRARVRPGEDVDNGDIAENLNFRQKLTAALKSNYSTDIYDVLSKMLERDASHRITAKVDQSFCSFSNTHLYQTSSRFYLRSVIKTIENVWSKSGKMQPPNVLILRGGD